MTGVLTVRRAGPGVTVQDRGRPGWIAEGLSCGGAADRMALAEGAALLGQDGGLAALEMAGSGGTFEAAQDTRIALTGAPMRAALDGVALAWSASHLLPRGAVLEIGGTTAGSYGYLHVGGGIDLPDRLGARSAHLAAGLGAAVAPGDLPVGADSGGRVGMALPVEDRFDGGEVRIVAGMQTALFGEAAVRFAATEFRRDARANRMGVRLSSDGEGFLAEGALNVLSEVIVPGDIQVTGDGTPFVLLTESQTTGGYPRLGTVIPPDLPRIAQAPAGAAVRFRFVTLEEAVAALRQWTEGLEALPGRLAPLVRDPAEIRDLLSYQLIGGVVSGFEEEPA